MDTALVITVKATLTYSRVVSLWHRPSNMDPTFFARLAQLPLMLTTMVMCRMIKVMRMMLVHVVLMMLTLMTMVFVFIRVI